MANGTTATAVLILALSATPATGAITISDNSGGGTSYHNAVRNDGTLLDAVNLGHSGPDVAINGVTFASTPGANPSGANWSATGPNVDDGLGNAGIDDIFFSELWGGASNVLSYTGLDAGTTYVVQILHGEPRSCCQGTFSSNTLTTDAGTQNVPAFTIGNGTGGEAPPAASDVAIVTAEISETTSFTYTMNGGVGRGSSIAAFQVRALQSADPAIAAAPGPILLQPVELPAPATARSITITNTGATQTLNLSGVSFGGTAGFQFGSPTFPATLAPGASGNIGFTFTPGTPGLSSATITIASDAEGTPNTELSLRIETLPPLIGGVSFRVYQADRPLTAMPTLGNDQTPNIDEARATLNYKDADKDGAADAGADGGFGTIPPLERLEHLYCEAIGVLDISTAGAYDFRLTADDGARLWVAGNLVVDNSGTERASPAAAESGPVQLAQGFHNLLIKFWNGTGGPCLKLEWRKPGSANWETIAAHDAGTNPDGLRTETYTRVVSPGDKVTYYPELGQVSGQLTSVHPGYTLHTIAGDFGAAGGDASLNPPDIIIEGTSSPYRPETGAIAFLADGTLLQSSFTPTNPGGGPAAPDGSTDHKIYAVSNATGGDVSAVTVREVANGLNGPMGIAVVGQDVYVAELHKIIRLRDENSDGDYLDAGEETTIAPVTANNFHNWTFGLIHQGGWLYCTLSANIGGPDAVGINGYSPATRGNWFRVNIDPANGAVGATEQLAGGLRTPNGLGVGPEGKMFGTDNQGSWNPDNSLYEFTPGHFYGHYNLWFQSGTQHPLTNPNGAAATGLGDPDRQPSDFWDSAVYWTPAETAVYADPYHGGTRRFTPPAVYLRQNEISNSPTDPVLIGDQHPSFKGQMFVGEHRNGGIRRVFLEKVGGRFQGAVFRFTQGLSCGANSMRWGPDGALYLGGIGGGGNWKWRNTTFGLERLKPNGTDAFEIQTLRATSDGFILTMTKPVAPGVLGNTGNYEPVKTSTYPNPSYHYGAGRVAGADLTVTGAQELPGGRSVRLTIPGITAGSVLHLRLKSPVVSAAGEPLWSGEAYYTMNAIPDTFESAWAEWVTLHFPGSADLEVTGPTANPDGDDSANLGEFLSGGNPKVGDDFFEFTLGGGSSNISIKSRELDPVPAPLTVAWKGSTDLESWTDITAEVAFVSKASVGGGYADVSYSYTPPAGAGRYFVRRVQTLP